MTEDNGVRAGHSAEPEPASSLGHSASVPDAAWGQLVERASTDIPYVLQVGRYAFFAVCAWGCGMSAGGMIVLAGAPRDLAHTTATVASVIAFIALRDMSKPWDLARKAVAQAIEARSGETARLDPKDESAVPEGMRP